MEENEINEIADFIVPEKKEEFLQTFPKHFSRASNIYGKFDNLAKELGIEKAEGVSTIDHYADSYQKLQSNIAEKEKLIKQQQAQIEAFGDKSKKWEDTELELKASFEKKQSEVNQKIQIITDAFLQNSVKNIKLAEVYADDNDLITAKLNAIKQEYDFRFEGAELVPYSNDQRALKDGKALTLQDLLNSSFERYISNVEDANKQTFEHKKSEQTTIQTPSQACRAAGLNPSSAEGRAFMVKYIKNKS